MVVAQTHDLNDMVEASHIASSAQPLWSDLPIRPASIATNLTNSHEWKSTAASLSLRLLSRAKANSIRRVGVAGTRTGDGATTTLCAILHAFLVYLRGWPFFRFLQPVAGIVTHLGAQYRCR